MFTYNSAESDYFIVFTGLRDLICCSTCTHVGSTTSIPPRI